MHARAAVTVKCPAEEVYRQCHDLPELCDTFGHLATAEIVDDVPHQTITWKSVDGSPATASVRFEPAPGDRGTEITLEIDYGTPAGAAGEILARILEGDPSEHVKEDLRGLKQLLEVGEVVLSGERS